MTDRPVRINQDRAQGLLKQCRWLLIICIVGFVLFAWRASTERMDGISLAFFAVYWLAGVGYFIWVGRLAYGLGRSAVYYIGGTLIASMAIFLIAHVIAYINIRSAVNQSFVSGPARNHTKTG
jgi:hypothetical protein